MEEKKNATITKSQLIKIIAYQITECTEMVKQSIINQSGDDQERVHILLMTMNDIMQICLQEYKADNPELFQTDMTIN